MFYGYQSQHQNKAIDQVVFSAEKKASQMDDFRPGVVAAFEQLCGTPFSRPKDATTIDLDAERLRRKVSKLNRENYGFMNFVYNPTTDKYKPWAFVRVWVNCQHMLKGKKASTQQYAAEMLQALLDCYKSKIQHGRSYPTKPWTEFDGMTPAMWKRTYSPLWLAMDEFLQDTDQELLNSLR